jgi:hypothetical protein
MIVISAQGVMATSMDNQNTGMTVPDYIFECWDGSGYADYPRGVSDMETTLKAVELLYEYQNKWHRGTWQQLDSLAEQYAAMQSPYRGGFVFGDVDVDSPDFKTTALILETLDEMGRLDVVDTSMVIRYLWSSFRGSINLRSLLTEGLFEDKYWAIKAADTLNSIQILGLREINLDNIIASDANMAEFPELDQYYRWNNHLLSNNEVVTTGFESRDLVEKLQVIDCLDYIIEDNLTQTLISSFIDLETFVSDIETRIDNDTGMVMTDSTLDTILTSDFYEGLDKIGKVHTLFNDDMGTQKIVDAIQEVETRLDRMSSEYISISELHSLDQINDILNDTINLPIILYSPRFDDSIDGIASWDVSERVTIVVPDIAWETPREPIQDHSPLSLFFIIALFGGVVASAAADNKRLAIILSIFCIFLFFGEYAYGVDAIMQQASVFLGDVLPDLSLNRSMFNFNMNRWGTTYMELKYADTVEKQDDELYEEIIDPYEPFTTATNIPGLSDMFTRGLRIEMDGNLRRYLFPNIADLEIAMTAQLTHQLLNLDLTSSTATESLKQIIDRAITLKTLKDNYDMDDADIDVLADEVVAILRNWDEGKSTSDDLIPSLFEWLIVQKIWNTHEVTEKRTITGGFVVTKKTLDGKKIGTPLIVSKIEDLQSLDKSFHYEITMVFSSAEFAIMSSQLTSNPTLKKMIEKNLARGADRPIKDFDEAVLFTAYSQVIMAAIRSGLPNVRVQAIVSYKDSYGNQIIWDSSKDKVGGKLMDTAGDSLLVTHMQKLHKSRAVQEFARSSFEILTLAAFWHFMKTDENNAGCFDAGQINDMITSGDIDYDVMIGIGLMEAFRKAEYLQGIKENDYASIGDDAMKPYQVHEMIVLEMWRELYFSKHNPNEIDILDMSCEYIEKMFVGMARRNGIEIASSDVVVYGTGLSSSLSPDILALLRRDVKTQTSIRNPKYPITWSGGTKTQLSDAQAHAREYGATFLPGAWGIRKATITDPGSTLFLTVGEMDFKDKRIALYGIDGMGIAELAELYGFTNSEDIDALTTELDGSPWIDVITIDGVKYSRVKYGLLTSALMAILGHTDGNKDNWKDRLLADRDVGVISDDLSQLMLLDLQSGMPILDSSATTATHGFQNKEGTPPPSRLGAALAWVADSDYLNQMAKDMSVTTPDDSKLAIATVQDTYGGDPIRSIIEAVGVALRDAKKYLVNPDADLVDASLLLPWLLGLREDFAGYTRTCESAFRAVLPSKHNQDSNKGMPTSLQGANGAVIKYWDPKSDATDHPGWQGIIIGLKDLAKGAGRESVLLRNIDITWLKWQLRPGTRGKEKGQTGFNINPNTGISSQILASLWNIADKNQGISPSVDISFRITQEGFVFLIYDVKRAADGTVVERIPLVSGTHRGLLRPVAQQGFGVDSTVTHGQYRQWVYEQNEEDYTSLNDADILSLGESTRLMPNQLARHVEMQAYDPEFQMMLYEAELFDLMSDFGKKLYGDDSNDGLRDIIGQEGGPPTKHAFDEYVERVTKYVRFHDEMNTRSLQLAMIEVKIQEAVDFEDRNKLKKWEEKREHIMDQIDNIDFDMFMSMSDLTSDYVIGPGTVNSWKIFAASEIDRMCQLSMGVVGESATEMAVTIAGGFFTGLGLRGHELSIDSVSDGAFSSSGMKSFFVGFYTSLMNVMSDAKYALESHVLSDDQQLRPSKEDGNSLLLYERKGGSWYKVKGVKFVVDVIDAKIGKTGSQDVISTDVYCIIYHHTESGDMIPIPLKTTSKKSEFYSTDMDIDRMRVSLDDGRWLILDIATSLTQPQPTTYRTPIWPGNYRVDNIQEAMDYTLNMLEKTKSEAQAKASVAMLRSLTARRYLISDPERVRSIYDMLELAKLNPNLEDYVAVITECLFHWIPMNPGPLMSDIDTGLIMNFINWWQDHFTHDYLSLNPVLDPNFIEADMLLNVGPFEPLDINEHSQSLISGWLADFIYNESESITYEMKYRALSTVAKEQMGYAPLADDWSYPPYQVAEWRYVGEGTDEGWYSLGGAETRVTDMSFGYAPISQKVVVNRDIKTSKMQLFLLDLGDIYNETTEFYVQVWHNEEMVSGSTVLRKEGITEVQLSRQIRIKAGDTVEISIPIQKASGKVALCHKDLLGSEMLSRDGGLTVERSPISNYLIFLKLFDVEKAGVSGWQKVGIRFEANYSAVDTVDNLIADAKNYLLTHFRANPNDRLPRTWIAATLFNTTSNETTVAYEEYEFRQTQIYTDIPDASQKYTPIYIYGEEKVDVDLLINSLKVSGQRVVKTVTVNELIDIIVNKKSGMLVFLTDKIPYEVLTIDSGASYIHEWLRSGNQIVTAGVLPFDTVTINSNTMSMYDYLFYSERATIGTSRLAEFNDVTNPSNLGGDGTSTGAATTYQCYDSTETNDTIDITLGPSGGLDDYMSFKLYMPYNDGSMTWMFPVSIPDVNRTWQYFQSIDIYMDDLPIFERFALDQMRDPSTGMGVSGKVFFSDGLYEGSRLFVQLVENVVQSDDTVDANFIFYLTVKDGLTRGTHTLEIRDCDDNAVDQEISFLKLNNLIIYENTYRNNMFRDVQSQYQGITSIGTGVFAVTGRDMIVRAQELGKNSIELNGVVSIEPTDVLYAIDTDRTPVYRTYGTDSTGKYGECTVRVGSGLITMVDMVPVEGVNGLQLINKINYLLTGITADWEAIIRSGMNVGDFPLGFNADEFEGLIVEVTHPDEDTRVHEAFKPDSDFRHDGAYAISFREALLEKTWLRGFSYRMLHTIQGSSGAGEDYQVEIIVSPDGSQSSGSGNTIEVAGKSKSDFSDIRFTLDDGLTELPHYLEYVDGSGNAHFWVKVVTSLDDDVDIFVYYGNPNAESKSNGDDTFLFFDNFEDDDLNEWDETGRGYYNWDTLNTTIAPRGDYVAYYDGAAQPIDIRYNFTDHAINVIDYSVKIHFFMRCADNTLPATWLRTRGNSGWTADLGAAESNDWSYQEGDGDETGSNWSPWLNNNDCSFQTWYEMELGLLPSTGKRRAWKDDMYMGELDWDTASGTNSELSELSFRAYKNTNHYIDDVYVRKWILTEPQHSSWSTEELSPILTGSTEASVIDADLDWDGYNSVHVNGSQVDINEEFSLKLYSTLIDSSVGYLLINVESLNCSVSVISSSWKGHRHTIMEIGEENGMFAAPLSPFDHYDLIIKGNATGTNAYFVLDWLGTSREPFLQSSQQAHIESFVTDAHLTKSGLEAGDTSEVISGALTMDIGADTTNDADSIWLNVDSFFDPRLVFEIKHKVNLTDMTDHTLKAILYSDIGKNGRTQELTLDNDTDFEIERHRIDLPQVCSIELVLISADTSADDIRWAIDWFEIVRDSDIIISFEGHNGLLSILPSDESPPTQNNVSYTQHGKSVDNGDGTFTYSTSLGEQNVWNGTHWVRYQYDPVLKTVKVGNLTISHNVGGSLRIDSNSGLSIGVMKWYVQAFYDDIWNNITLDNYQFVGFIKYADNVSAVQRFWGMQGEMNLTITYGGGSALKVRVDITNWANQTVPIRAIWAAQQVERFQYADFDSIKNKNNETIGFILDGTGFIWDDVDNTLPDLAVETYIDKPHKRAAIVFGNQSNLLSPGETQIIDPTYYENHGDDDATWKRYQSSWYHYDGRTYLDVCYDSGANEQWYAGVCFEIGAIPNGASISSATLEYTMNEATGNDFTFERISEKDSTTADVDNLELYSASPPPSVDSSPTVTQSTYMSGGESVSVTSMVQEHVNLAAYGSGDSMGFWIESSGTDTTSSIISYEGSGTEPRLVVSWSVNNAPSVDENGVVTNIDDTDKMYPRYKIYTATTTVSDADGATDIDYVYFDMKAEFENTFRLKYTEYTNAFSEISGTSNVELITGSCSYDKSGNDLDLTFAFKIEWAHTAARDDSEYADMATVVWVVDEGAAGDSQQYNVGYDVEKEFSLSSISSGPDDRGNIGGTFTAEGEVTWYNSAVNPDDEGLDIIDVWYISSGIGTGEWSDTALNSGDYSMSVDIDEAMKTCIRLTVS